MSLVCLPEASAEFGVAKQRVVFVQWTSVDDKCGRIAHLDGLSRLTFSTGMFHPLREFVNSEVLYPQTGLLKMKSTRGARQQVSEKFLQLQKMAGIVLLGPQWCIRCRRELCMVQWHQWGLSRGSAPEVRSVPDIMARALFSQGLRILGV